MSAILVISKRCSHSMGVVKYVNEHDVFKTFIKYHDVNAYGIPKGYTGIIKSVPTLILQNGTTISGAEQIVTNLNSLLPEDTMGAQGWGSGFGASLDDDDDAGDFCDINRFGGSIKPQVSPDLIARTEMNVSEAYNSSQQR